MDVGTKIRRYQYGRESSYNFKWDVGVSIYSADEKITRSNGQHICGKSSGH